MKRSWIDIDNQTQEAWARQYLLKKRAGMTRSNEGLSASNEWHEPESALRFLLSLEKKKGCEASSVLLKKMKLSWAQQINKHRTKKTRPVNISLQSSNELKWLAKTIGMTKVRTMESLIAEAAGTQRSAIGQQKELHNQRKQKLEKCEFDLNAVEIDKHRLESEQEDLRTENLQLRRDVEKQKATIKLLEDENQQVKSELEEIKDIFKM